MGLFDSLINVGLDIVKTPFSLAEDVLEGDISLEETRATLRELLKDIK